MSRTSVTNPYGALRKVSDFRTFVSDDGENVAPFPPDVITVRANATVAKGDVVNWVVPTQTVPVSVTPMAAATVGSLFAGVANHAAASGDDVQITVRGFALVKTNGAPAFGQPLAKPSTTTGEALPSAALDATTVTGTIIGVALAAEAANGLAPMIVEHM